MISGSRSRGATLLEAILAILLLTLVVPGAWKILAVQRAAGVHVARRAEGLETVRTVGWLLPREVSSGRPGVDWVSNGGDSLGLRAFRGQGMVDDRVQGRGYHQGLLLGDSKSDSGQRFGPPPGKGRKLECT